MKTLTMSLLVMAALLLAEPVAAQTGETGTAPPEEDLEYSEADFAARMRAAEARLAEAAREVAELSTRRLPRVADIERRLFDFSGRPRLGVTIGNDESSGPVEGVGVIGVTPGSAASDAGLRAGDVITSINDEPLSAATAGEANRRLLDFMKGVEEGDTVDIEYLRNGNVGRVSLEPRVAESHADFWVPSGRDYAIPGMPDVHIAPGFVDRFRNGFSFRWSGAGWRDMELVELSEGLGRYFGTESGLLVVSAPTSDALKLQDGDVIQSIDGRVPTSVRHAMRILGSYQAGEELELGIMRDKKRRTLKIEIPDDRRSTRSTPLAPAQPPAAVIPPVATDST